MAGGRTGGEGLRIGNAVRMGVRVGLFCKDFPIFEKGDGMGAWDYKPWDNDAGADWYADLMDQCAVRAKWLEGIEKDVEEEAEIVRAAVGLFILLGHVYIWPNENYARDLELAIEKMRQLLENPEYAEDETLITTIRGEYEELVSRRKPDGTGELPEGPTKPWWQFWK